MNGVITLGTFTIPLDTAYKVSVIGLLTTIAASLAYMAYWIST